MSEVGFQKYKQLFTAKKYDQAFVALESIRSELEPALFSYNMAILNQKMGKLTMARYHFEKALANGLGNENVYKNLEIVKTKLGVTTLEKSEVIDDYFYSNSLLMDTDYLIVIVLGILLVSAALYKKINKYILIVINTLAVIVTATAFFLKVDTVLAINFEELIIYQGPSKIFEVVQTSPSGMKLTLEKSSAKWIRVISPSRFKGYIENKGYKEL